MPRKTNPSVRTRKPTTSRGEGTKAKLLDAGTELIWLHGFGSVTTDQICERAGVHKGSFYHFFNSKQDLAAAAIEANWTDRQPNLDRIFSPSNPPMERFKLYFSDVFERQERRKQRYGHVMGCIYFCLGAEVSLHGSPISRNVQEIIARYCKYLESALRDAHAEGVLNVPNPSVMARTLFSYIEGCLTQARIANDLQFVKSMSEGAMLILESGGQAALRKRRRPVSAV